MDLPRPWLALFQPDMPGNLGAALRLGACLDVPVHVIEPCGFPLDDRRLRRAGMDYIDQAVVARHPDFPAFLALVRQSSRRLVLLSRHARASYHRFPFAIDDVLLVGRESSGVPEEVAAACGVSLRIPLKPPLRSLNVVTAAAMALGQVLAGLDAFPSPARLDEE